MRHLKSIIRSTSSDILNAYPNSLWNYQIFLISHLNVVDTNMRRKGYCPPPPPLLKLTLFTNILFTRYKTGPLYPIMVIYHTLLFKIKFKTLLIMFFYPLKLHPLIMKVIQNHMQIWNSRLQKNASNVFD